MIFQNNIGKLKKLPLLMIITISMIAIVGFTMLFFAAHGNIRPWASKQIIGFMVFFILMIFISLINIKILYKFSYHFYIISLILLFIVELLGHTAMGATRWMNLGLFKIQPSEIMKISLLFALSKYFHNIKDMKIKSITIPLILVITPVLLILKQPDLGTAIVLILMSGLIFFVAGTNIYYFIIIAVIVSIFSPILWHHMHDYQKQRIMIFLNPESDPLGSGYNIIQSKIAIGSGGFFGKGLMGGTQTQLDFLPEHQTDFIFTTICEELGFIGAVTIILLYSLIICYSMYISVNCKNKYGRLLSFGIASMFFLHIFINIAMVMGLLPVVGVPLPLLSYGRTMMMTIMIGFGIVSNVKIHSKIILSRN